jgi:hypothetical protein
MQYIIGLQQFSIQIQAGSKKLSQQLKNLEISAPNKLVKQDPKDFIGAHKQS